MVDTNKNDHLHNRNGPDCNEPVNKLSHINEKGEAHMVDVGNKNITRRKATASASIKTRADVIQMITRGSVSKGDVLATARIAGIMAAKRTQELIPLCHPVTIDSIQIDMQLNETTVNITSTIASTGKTGVEMEAITAVTIAAITIYDMCKSVDKAMTIVNVQLDRKSGGKSGNYKRL